ncbi:bifunctional phosphoglucose/phosphomannose isomerase [Eisenibacter elegans]|jgi:glucose/mannose-6-phosphate isomerase|uniref:bifunctional phosphoglucose/phosphomannose isomerase n=1 Tax=Eisenibacter elegans TaxID=997 RepID=UPI00040993B3|nr:bifunctional phosphoglucose/phosphomannose isomerase [Eisenibacter elegans]
MMQSLIEGFAQQLAKGLDIGGQVADATPRQPIHQVVVAGLGGSGIGGDLLSAWVSAEAKVPVIVIKGYQVPAFVNANTLFIASSFSGNTEETLSTLSQALELGAQIACVSSGGKVLEIAQQRSLFYIQIPQEAACPRAFVGYSVVSLLYTLSAHGLISKAFETQVQAAVTLIKENVITIRQTAQQLAKACHKKLPYIYADDQFAPVILRLQQQINENAKQLCHTHVFPEMNHNELVGWEQPKVHYAPIVVLYVRSELENPRVRARMDICEPIIKEKAADFQVITPKGATLLIQSIYLIHLFDWLSFELAELNAVDPFPVKVINFLKDELAKQ